MNTQTSSLDCTLVSCRQETVRSASPTIPTYSFSQKWLRDVHLKTCSYFGEVDNMQMICECTHENILKQWGKSFPKQQVFIGIKGPNFIKGTNGRQKTCEIFHVNCIFHSGFMCQTTVIFGITKDGSLVLNPLASWNCFTCRNLFQNGANDMSEWLTCETAFCKKSSKICIVRIIRFRSNFTSLW